MKSLPTANDLKIDILSWIIAQLSADEVLASELRFLDGERRADLVVISKNRLTAIEVKGPRDNLNTLKTQIIDYQKMFLDVYVATSAKHLQNVRALVPKTVGLINASSGRIDIIRQSTPKKNLEKSSSAQWLLKNDFNGLHNALSTSRKDDIDHLRHVISRKTGQRELQQLALATIFNRALTRHNGFIKELGQTMTLDDVRMLTIEENIKF